MNSKPSPIGPGIVLLLALTIGGWFLQQGLAQDQDAFQQARLLDEVVDHIADRYVDEVDRDDLYEYAIDGILEELGDPNTSLLNTNAYEDFRIRTEGDYGGVGLEIVERDEYITVVSALPGAPGARAGIRAGDRIVGVADQSTRGWSAQRAVEDLRGPPGSSIQVTIERLGVDASIDFTLTRERIRLRSVPFAMLIDESVGYVPLRLFSETSTREVRAAADSLRDEGASSVILDLRANPGGVLDEGVGVADLFLERGAGVVETRGDEGGPNGMLSASNPDRYEGMPVVVLVDRSSASASEIVAGALQDHDRGLLVGTSTFGKGSVQSLFNLTGGNVLKLTTARWYTPLGRSIERMGNGTDAEPGGVVGLGDYLPITVTGEYALPADTAGRPTVTSEAGRSLYGGGGIVPDILISADTLSSVEQTAVRELFREGGAYTAGRFSYAVQYLQTNPDAETEFEIGPAELADFFDQLREERGVDLDAETLRQAGRFVEIDLEREIALQAWGDIGEFEQSMTYDQALQTALELLGAADSPDDLFRVAGSSAAASRPPVSVAGGGR